MRKPRVGDLWDNTQRFLVKSQLGLEYRHPKDKKILEGEFP